MHRGQQHGPSARRTSGRFTDIRKPLGLIALTAIVMPSAIEARGDVKDVVEHQTEILSWLAEFNVPAVGIGIIKGGKIHEAKVFGELRKGVSARDDAIFTIASVTKPVVAMVTLKLVESKQWDLDGPIHQYWIDPHVANDSRHKMLTTRHILSHRSGLPNWRRDIESGKLEFISDPGTQYQYSGEGFEYLKKALEERFHRSLEEISDSVLFKPLHMHDTGYRWRKKIDESRFAFRHDSQRKEYQNQGGTQVSAAGGLLTTVHDFSRFGIDVMNHAGLSKNLYGEMIRAQANIKRGLDQGLGWQIVRGLPNGEYALIHEGGEWGVSTIAVFLPMSKRGIVVFTNGDQGNKVCFRVLERFLDGGKEIVNVLNRMSYDPAQLGAVTVSDDVLSGYVGSYFIPSFRAIIRVTHEDHSLRLESRYAKFVLYAESENKFFLKEDDLRLEFKRNKSGEITGMMVIIKGGKPEFAEKRD